MLWRRKSYDAVTVAAIGSTTEPPGSLVYIACFVLWGECSPSFVPRIVHSVQRGLVEANGINNDERIFGVFSGNIAG